ncbi:hypothetical protein XELAEV_18004537mg [Xenopus laevis]|uniref:Uncharacterized protein n=1 Tax=Xenopus laevis TaxID=8355 RepID=A0A974BNE3_XENLA|nr:hypothetical protein XELAEV_18004537mg [Xenopus laevis]
MLIPIMITVQQSSSFKFINVQILCCICMYVSASPVKRGKPLDRPGPFGNVRNGKFDICAMHPEWWTLK